MTEQCRAFIYPFGFSARIAPLGVERSVPDFLKAKGVLTDTWRQAWDRIDQTVGKHNQIRKQRLIHVITTVALIGSGPFFGGLSQGCFCGMLDHVDDLHFDRMNEFGIYDFLQDLCPIEEGDSFILAGCFFALYEACILYFLVRRGLVLEQKRCKVLRRILNKVRYVCEDLEDGHMYFWARANYDLQLITVDIFKSKPPEAYDKDPVASEEAFNDDDTREHEELSA